MVEKLNDLARKCGLFIDNAATASQVDFDDVAREAIQLNVFAPMLVEVSERDGLIASLQEQVEKLTREREEAQSGREAYKTMLEQAEDDLAKLREGAEPGERIDLPALNAWFPDGVPVVAVKIMFPEKSEPLTTAEVRHVLAALASHPTEQPGARSGVRVRELEWHFDLKRKCYEADTPIAKVYCVKELAGSDSPYFETSGGGSWTLLYEGDDLPSAKAAAQADYERRILSALSPAAPEGREAENYFIQEREDDMLICAPDWQFGNRCIARRPKMATNEEWRPTAEMIIAALSRPTGREVTEAMVDAAQDILLKHVEDRALILQALTTALAQEGK